MEIGSAILFGLAVMLLIVAVLAAGVTLFTVGVVAMGFLYDTYTKLGGARRERREG